MAALPGGRVAFDADDSIGIWEPATGMLRYFDAGHSVYGLVAHMDGRLISHDISNVLCVWAFAADGASAQQVMLGFEDAPHVAHTKGIVAAAAEPHLRTAGAVRTAPAFEFESDTDILKICPIDQVSIAILTDNDMMVLSMIDFQIRHWWQHDHMRSINPPHKIRVVHNSRGAAIVCMLSDQCAIYQTYGSKLRRTVVGAFNELVPVGASGAFLARGSTGDQRLITPADARLDITRLPVHCDPRGHRCWALNDGRIVMIDVLNLESGRSAILKLRAAPGSTPWDGTAAAVDADSMVFIDPKRRTLAVWNAELNRVAVTTPGSKRKFARIVGLSTGWVVAQTPDGQLSCYR
jgi:hypothetical protein